MPSYSLQYSSSDDDSVSLKSGESSKAKANDDVKSKFFDGVEGSAKTSFRRSRRGRSIGLKNSSSNEVCADLLTPNTVKRKNTSKAFANLSKQSRPVRSSRRNMKSASYNGKNGTITRRARIGQCSARDMTPKKSPPETDPEEPDSIADGNTNGNIMTPKVKAKMRTIPAKIKREERVETEGGVAVVAGNFDDVNHGCSTAEALGADQLLATPSNLKEESFSDVILPRLRGMSKDNSPVQDPGDIQEDTVADHNCGGLIKKLSAAPKKLSPNDGVEAPIGVTSLLVHFNEELKRERNGEDSEDDQGGVAGVEGPGEVEDTETAEKFTTERCATDALLGEDKHLVTPSNLKERSFSGAVRPVIAGLGGEEQGCTVAANNCDEIVAQLSAATPFNTVMKPSPNDEAALALTTPAIFALFSDELKGEFKDKESKGDQGILARVQCPGEEEDTVKAEKRDEDFAFTRLNKDLSDMNIKSLPDEEGATKKTEGLSSSNESTVLGDEVTMAKMMLLDLSYLKSGVNAVGFVGEAFSNAHKRRVMLILDDPRRTEEIIVMCLRNNKDIELLELMRQFDFFSI